MGEEQKLVIVENRPYVDDLFTVLAQASYNYLMTHVHFNDDARYREVILMQSVQGHAHEGHVAFATGHKDTKDIIRSTLKREGKRNGYMHGDVHVRYQNATIEDVIAAIGKKKENKGVTVPGIHDERQEYIDEIIRWKNIVTRYLLRKSDRPVQIYKLVNEQGSPLLDYGLFDHTMLKHPEVVLIGLAIGGLLDNHEYRRKAEAAFKIDLHQGICVPINLRSLSQQNLTLQDLARNGGELSLDELTNKGVIPKKTVDWTQNFCTGYFELKKGFGVSDDAAFLALCLMYGFEAGLGFFLADAIDTLDKSASVITYGGQDEALSKKVFGDLRTGKLGIRLKEEDVLRVIYLASVDVDVRNCYPSCSQRRFLELNKSRLSALDSHIIFYHHITDAGTSPPFLRIAVQKESNSKFYENFKNRWNKLYASGQLERYKFNQPIH
ncbi:hypothetical protein C4573_06835 [Candidatus Woesearchaeota archaeon]|nr:MAG: hypothetical protein C4573_06835 [Candidatus Woesearchaeota archaeon]